MAAGHVNRTTLEANYQNSGDVYDDTKTEGAFEVIAQQVDDNYDEAHAVKTSLASTTDGSSGADYVKATAISGITGATVQAILEAIVAAGSGSLPADGVITDAKLSAAATDIKARFAAHKAELVTDGVHGMGSIASKNYENGTWTPILVGSTVAGTHTYSISVGRYIRIGDRVFLSGRMLLSAKDDAMSGDAKVTGLPFTSVNNANEFNSSSPEYRNIELSTSGNGIVHQIAPNDNKITLLEMGSNIGVIAVTADKIKSNSYISFSINYSV